MPTRTRKPQVVEPEDIDDKEVDDDEFEDDEEEETETPHKSHVKVKEQKPTRVIKYMGSADVKYLSPNETLLDTVGPEDALKETLVWSHMPTWTDTRGAVFAPNAGHIVIADEHPNVSDEFWDALVALPDFQDVTDAYNDPDQKVPKSAYDAMWRHLNDHTGGI